ncbi:MAG: hypothetical protein VW235_09045, partial [Rhodospirillaceae bacterium]
MQTAISKYLSRKGISVSPFLPMALLPMIGLIGIVIVFVWVSFQTGTLGTDEAEFSTENYLALFGDEFVLEVLENTFVFAVATTA